MRKVFVVPQLIEFGRLSEIVQMPHQGESHKDEPPPGLDGRLDSCDEEGPKKAAKADANWFCGSS